MELEAHDHPFQIDFEAGANLVLLVWEPPAADASLALRFEDRSGRPKITFEFAE